MNMGQDLDAMIEARNAREWEELNRTPEIPAGDICDELDGAWGELSEGYDRLSTACEKAEGHPVKYRIESVLDMVDKLQTEIRKIQKEAGKDDADC